MDAPTPSPYPEPYVFRLGFLTHRVKHLFLSLTSVLTLRGNCGYWGRPRVRCRQRIRIYFCSRIPIGPCVKLGMERRLCCCGWFWFGFGYLFNIGNRGHTATGAKQENAALQCAPQRAQLRPQPKARVPTSLKVPTPFAGYVGWVPRGLPSCFSSLAYIILVTELL